MSLAEAISVSGIIQRPDFEADAKKAVEWGARALHREGRIVTLPGALPDVIWRLFQDAAQTLSKLPDRESVWLLSHERSGWPEVAHTAQELYEAELQRLVDLQERTETVLSRLPITDPTAIPRMLTVLEWLRFVTAYNFKNIKRDKLVVLALASGQSCDVVSRRLMGTRTPSAAHMVKKKVCGQIALQLKSACGFNGCC